MIPPNLLRAYRCTTYRVAGAEIRIGRRSPVLDRILRQAHVQQAALISAHNPRSRRMPPAWNDRRHRALLQLARRHPAMPAVGTWRNWSEDHLLLLGPVRPAIRLARNFRQYGIVIFRIGQPACLCATS